MFYVIILFGKNRKNPSHVDVDVNSAYRKFNLFFAAQTGCPITNTTDWVITEPLRTCVFPTDNASNFHFSTGNELSTR